MMAGHRTFSGALHEFPACCLSDRATCPLVHTALPHLVKCSDNNAMSLKVV